MATLPLRAILQYSSQRVAASRDGKLVVVSGTVRLKATHFPNGGVEYYPHVGVHHRRPWPQQQHLHS